MSISLNRLQLAEVFASQVLCAPIECRFGSEQSASFRGVAFDSREISGGELFIALKGEQMHGHAFLEKAFARGASLALVEDSDLLESSPHKESLVWVPDTMQAFWKLAAWWRQELKIPVLGVTGSMGKTTIKEMVASILLQHSLGSYSLKSYNNHTGVPYTICCASPQHEWLVLEMGMNSPGELRQLTQIARPDVAVVASIGLAHVQDFNSIDEIADAKFEIFEGLKQGGICITPAEEEVFERAFERHPLPAGVQARHFSEKKSENSVCWYENFEIKDLSAIEFDLHFADESAHIHLKIPAQHNARNAACAALAARSLLPQLSLDEIVRGLSRFRPPGMRMNIKHSLRGPVIVDDCYNANPPSMRAALSLMAELESRGKRTGYILGDMLELGVDSAKYHQEIGQIVSTQNPEYVVAVGEFAVDLVAQAKQRGVKAFVTPTPVAAAHTASKIEVDAILVKASRGVQLDKAVNTLLELFGGERPPGREGGERG